MEKIKIKDLSFSYATSKKQALSKISLEIEEGDFVLLFGKSGSGKSTLLRMLKNEAMPHGDRQGEILIDGNKIEETDTSTKIGFVMQNVENQIVCDKVWHELAFGLENLKLKQEEMRIRVAENCYFFNLQDIFDLDTAKLSGGQKEIVVLASVMMMNPDVLVLDEPFSKLDTTVKEELLKYLKKIHEELGTTIIIAEHHLDELIPMASKVIVMDEGKVDYQGKTSDVLRVLLQDQKYFDFLPNMLKIPSLFKDKKVLFQVADARKYLKEHESYFDHKKVLEAEKIAKVGAR